MGIGSWSGGIVLLVAAVLWLVYLMPSWHARRQYLATERNAVRLQQTLRILAQTAELPDEIRIEMNAKSLAEAQKVAASEEARRRAIVRAHEAARQREITRRLAESAPELDRASSQPALTAMRMRRSRLVATLLGFAGIVVAVGTLVVAPGMWLVVLAATLVVVGSVTVLAQLAAVARARSRRLSARPTGAVAAVRGRRRPSQASASGLIDADGHAGTADAATDAAVADRTWTPVEVPKPLYVARPDVEREQAAARRAAAESSAALAARLRERVAAAAAEADAAAAMRSAARAAEATLRGERGAGGAHGAGAAPAARVTPIHGDPVAAELAATPAATPAPASASNPASDPASDLATDPAAPPSRFAGMGVLDAGAYEPTDIDAVLRRRRAV